jgi:hypothetical protein
MTQACIRSRYAAELWNDCGIQSWTHNCHIVHATSKTASGPFTYKDTPIGPFSCNPHAIELPDSSLALFHIGEGVGTASVNCTDKPPYGHAPLPHETWPNQTVKSTVHLSKTVDGPWSASSPSDLHCNNPAPAVHPNGTIFVVCHGGSVGGSKGTGMQSLFAGPSVHGPWTMVSGSMDWAGTTVAGSPGQYHTVWEVRTHTLCSAVPDVMWMDPLHGLTDSLLVDAGPISLDRPEDRRLSRHQPRLPGRH